MAGLHRQLTGALAAVAVTASAHGLWSTPERGGVVELFSCGQALCGRLASSDALLKDPGMTDRLNKDPALRGRPLKGLVFLSGFAGGPARWEGGAVYNPQDGRTYRGSIELVDAQTLKLKGCVIAPLCKTQVWTRAR